MYGTWSAVSPASTRPRDVRMIQFREQRAFARQALARLYGRESADEFQRDALPRVAEQAFGEEHRAHAADAEFADDAIRPELRGRRCRIRHGGAQRGVARVVTLEQATHHRADVFVGFAGLQEYLTPLRRQIERCLEKVLDALEARAFVVAGRSVRHVDDGRTRLSA